jgi:hypothetical protein
MIPQFTDEELAQVLRLLREIKRLLAETTRELPGLETR